MTQKKSATPVNTLHSELIDEVVTLTLSLAQRLQQHATASAAEFDMPLSQAKVLMEMQEGEAIPMSTLAMRLGYDASNLTGVVDKLENRGALQRQPDKEDRRVKNLVLTAEGQQLQEAFRRRLLDHTGSFGPLTPVQMQQLRDLLQLVIDPDEAPAPQ